MKLRVVLEIEVPKPHPDVVVQGAVLAGITAYFGGEMAEGPKAHAPEPLISANEGWSIVSSFQP